MRLDVSSWASSGHLAPWEWRGYNTEISSTRLHRGSVGSHRLSSAASSDTSTATVTTSAETSEGSGFSTDVSDG